MKQQDIINELQQLYQKIDQRAEQVTSIHGTKLTCHQGCDECCIDKLTVFKVEAENIHQQAENFLRGSIPAEIGKCAFLSSLGSCQIYSCRPYVCRTQGLPLRWLEQNEEGAWVEYRDICPLNKAVEPIENLITTACWEIGPYEQKLAHLQAALEDGKMTRVSLRSLFNNTGVE